MRQSQSQVEIEQSPSRASRHYRRTRSSTVSSPTEIQKQFHEFENVFSSSEEEISRVDGTRTGREIPGGAPGYPLWRSASRGERQQPINQPDEQRNCGAGESQSKDKDARRSEGMTTNTDSFAGKGD